MTRVYQYDVFISYRRHGNDVPAWVRTHFYPRLREMLNENFERDVDIFFDGNIATGADRVLQSQAALKRTRILLPVCSPRYFWDEWCLREWHSMWHRERRLHGALPGNPPSLIYPVIFCDSQNFPDYAKARRMRDFNDWNQSLPQFQDTVDYLRFNNEVGETAQELVELIRQAPEWSDDWPDDGPDPEPPPVPGPPPTSKLPRF
ncbi:TIR domain-containing protein [Actinokineospora sp. PR83]|uniref:TIR domain-containing protein n=1 Tax=Actinokineospora sp. PR83 TaxID=2884908 RepID=UPI001F162393|nr:TIR domain-containing protein [Actinokineospora sp. PR83]MCG8914311.1 TIR domain-containing protein [Actinokineospora sp. PR83]